MPTDFNTNFHINASGSPFNASGGPWYGEDKFSGDASHEDQLSIRHAEDGGDLLTVIIGNTVEGVDNDTQDHTPEEDIRPARVWLVPDPWGSPYDTDNDNWPDWWANSGVASGYHLQSVGVGSGGSPYFDNLLTVDRISFLASGATGQFIPWIKGSYPVFIGNRVSIRESNPGFTEAGCIRATTTVERCGFLEDPIAGKYLTIAGDISARCSMNTDGLESGNVSSFKPIMASFGSNIPTLGSFDANGDLAGEQPQLRVVAGYFSDFSYSLGIGEKSGQDDTRQSLSRYGIGYVSKLPDGLGFGPGADGIGMSFADGGYAAGFVARAAEPSDVSIGNRRAYGLMVRDLAENGFSRVGDDGLAGSELVCVKIDAQNQSDHSRYCDIFGIHIGDMTRGTNSANGKTVRAIQTTGGDIHFNGPGTDVANPREVNVMIGDGKNHGRLTIGDQDIEAKNALGSSTLRIAADLVQDASNDAFCSYYVAWTPTGWDNNNRARRVAGNIGALLIVSGTNPNVGDPTDPMTQAAGAANGVVVNPCTVQNNAIVGGSVGYFQSAQDFGNVLIDDMAALVGEYYFGVNGLDADLGDWEGAGGAILNAFGLYAQEPDGTGSSATTAAGVFDGDVAISSGAKLYLDATTNWRTSSAMNKGGKSIYIAQGGANAGKLVYHDGTTEKQIALV